MSEWGLGYEPGVKVKTIISEWLTDWDRDEH